MKDIFAQADWPDAADAWMAGKNLEIEHLEALISNRHDEQAAVEELTKQNCDPYGGAELARRRSEHFSKLSTCTHAARVGVNSTVIIAKDVIPGLPDRDGPFAVFFYD